MGDGRGRDPARRLRGAIRPGRAEDKELFVAGWERFGEESRYRRFMGAKGGLSERDLAYFTEVDHADHEALGALDAETGEGVGVARYVRLADSPRPPRRPSRWSTSGSAAASAASCCSA